MKLIINADDFGLSKSITDGIVEGIKFGSITSTSIMVNMPYVKYAVEKAIENARKLEKKYNQLGKTIYDSIDDMNPYSNVYTLVEQLMLLIS